MSRTIKVAFTNDDLELLLATITIRKSQIKNFPYATDELRQQMASHDKQQLADLEKIKHILEYEYERGGL